MLKLQFLLAFLAAIFSFSSVGADDTPSPAPEPVEHTTIPSTFEEAVPISYEGAFAKMLLTLAGLIVLIFLTVWVLRRVSQGRFGGAGAGRSIKILEKRALSPKSVLYLLEIGGKKIVIAESQLEVRRITTFDIRSSEEE